MPHSIFFQDFDPAEPDHQAFLHDVRRLAGATPRVRDEALRRISDYIRAGATPDKRAIVEATSAASGATPIDVAYHMRCLETLLTIFSDDASETPERLADDFVACGAIPAEMRVSLVLLFGVVKERATEDGTLIDEATALRGVLPLLETIETTAELRGIFHRSPTTYSGEETFAGFVGIMSIHLGFDTGADMYFQCNRSLAEYLVREINAGLKRLDHLEAQTLSTTPTAVKAEESQSA